MNTAPRRALLLAALAAVRVKTQAPEFAILHAWLDSWSGLGLIVLGMHRHSYDLSLTHDRNGWRATFLHRSHVLYPWVGQVLCLRATRRLADPGRGAGPRGHLSPNSRTKRWARTRPASSVRW